MTTAPGMPEGHAGQWASGVEPAAPRVGSRFLWTPVAALAAAGAIASFHLAFAYRPAAFLVAVYLLCMSALAWVRTTRLAFYLGMLVGLGTWGPQLAFFADVFSYGAIGLWLAASLWTGVFLLLARSCAGTLGRRWAVAAIPVIWTGWEFFRGELNPLRFTWLNAGQAFWESAASVRLDVVGVYGIAFAILGTVAILQLLPRRVSVPLGILLLAGLGLVTNLRPSGDSRTDRAAEGPLVVGIQLELPSETEVLAALNLALQRHPQADLLAMSELTFLGPVPPSVRDWCRARQRFLVVGGTEPAAGPPGSFRNTVFVVAPDGNVVFSQAKSVPVPFFEDGLPAESRRVWRSPWGAMAVCVCFDLGFARVMDDFLRQGAGAILCPVLDKARWGRQEHLLHARVGPIRAVEYRVGVLRACSSGISQLVLPDGTVADSAGFPGRGEMVFGRLPVTRGGSLPLDRLLAPACAAATAALIVAMTAIAVRNRFRRPPRKTPPASEHSTPAPEGSPAP